MRKVTKQTGTKLAADPAAELRALQVMPDSEVDYSGVPPAKPEEWRDAVVGKFYRPIKQQVTGRE